MLGGEIMELKVTIKVKGVEVKDLTIEEVKELRDILDKIVTKPKEIVVKEIIKEIPVYRYWDWYPNYPTTTWGGTSDYYPPDNITISYCD